MANCRDNIRDVPAMLNLNSQTLDELAARIGQAFEHSPAKDLEKNAAVVEPLRGSISLRVRVRQREAQQRTHEKVRGD